jgi:hypothetical protein
MTMGELATRTISERKHRIERAVPRGLDAQRNSEVT